MSVGSVHCSRYYFAAGAGGIAIGVHMTQFAIRDPKYNLFEAGAAEITKEELDRADKKSGNEPLVRISGITGKMDQAVKEAELIRELGFHAGLLSLAMMKEATGGRIDRALQTRFRNHSDYWILSESEHRWPRASLHLLASFCGN